MVGPSAGEGKQVLMYVDVVEVKSKRPFESAPALVYVSLLYMCTGKGKVIDVTQSSQLLPVLVVPGVTEPVAAVMVYCPHTVAVGEGVLVGVLVLVAVLVGVEVQGTGEQGVAVGVGVPWIKGTLSKKTSCCELALRITRPSVHVVYPVVPLAEE